MAELICHHCRRPAALRRTLHETGPRSGVFECRACIQDQIGGHPPGYTVAKRSPAVKLKCPHCGAQPGQLCTGPGVVRFLHARRRDAAEAITKKAREDGSYGN